MQILVRPCYDVGLNNQIFEPSDPRADHHKNPWIQWREIGKAQGQYINTWDQHPLPQADLIWVQDLPASRQEILDARQAAPEIPFVLQIYESPVDRVHFHDTRNHDLFDAVITYNPKICDEQRYFHYQLPVGIPASLPTFKPFLKRKPLVMVNTNTYSGWLAPRNLGATGIPLIGPRLGGWQTSAWEVIQQQNSSLYNRRRKLARLAEKRANLLEVYGAGWQGETASWIHKIVPAKPFKNALGRTIFSKIETLSHYRFCLAFENFVGSSGYISEKIFDCFYAGVVPIYLGDENITQYVPKAAFIDAREFRDLEILEYVQDCSEAMWLKHYQAGQDYLSSDKLHSFQPQAFVQRMLEIAEKVVDRRLKSY